MPTKATVTTRENVVAFLTIKLFILLHSLIVQKYTDNNVLFLLRI